MTEPAKMMPISDGFPKIVAVAAGGVALLLATAGTGIANLEPIIGGVQLISRFVPEIGIAIAASQFPNTVGMIAASQWIFGPIYALVWLRREAPWREIGQPPQERLAKILWRTVAYILTVLFLLCYALSNFGLPLIPTFFSGSALSPDLAPLWIIRLSHSTFGMAFLLWLSPIVEVFMLWLLAFYICQAPVAVKRLRKEQS